MALISKAKCDLAHLIATLDRLKSIENNLEANINNFNDEDWRQLLSTADNDRPLIQEVLTKYESTSPLLKLALKQRTKTRASRKRRKATRKVPQEAPKASTCSQNKKSPLSEQILCGINKKKLEAQNYIDLLDSINRLNHVKQTKQGGDLIDEESVKKINGLKAIWRDSLENYKLEEKELQKLAGDTKSVDDQWSEVLFGGDGGVADESHRMGLNAFIKRRRQWDVFIQKGTEGSSIPINWILPDENASESWRQFRHK